MAKVVTEVAEFSSSSGGFDLRRVVQSIALKLRPVPVWHQPETSDNPLDAPTPSILPPSSIPRQPSRDTHVDTPRERLETPSLFFFSSLSLYAYRIASFYPRQSVSLVLSIFRSLLYQTRRLTCPLSLFHNRPSLHFSSSHSLSLSLSHVPASL